jgi:hypothetical protein
MNITNFLFQLFHICNLPTLVVLTPPRSPCTPSTDYAHLSVDCEDTSSDYINFSTDCANNFDDYVNTLDD